MDRQKAVIASAALAGSLVTGGIAFALTGGALAPRQDNVGKLQPTTSLVAATPARDVATTVPAAAPDPAGAIQPAPASRPPATVSKASPAASSAYEDDDHQHEDHEYEHDSDGDDD